mmetsp:Transcript_28927/g.84018  ORF Transcript_28927/g.84018 Transcript_28927/m.84018 type:complete len:107 (+) Transcript_28927:458-778(+)
MVKPLFGLSSSAAPADKTEADATGDETEAAPGSSVALPDTDETKASAAVSDSHGQGGQVTGLAVLFEALTDELGEGFRGDGIHCAASIYAAWCSGLVRGALWEWRC